MVGNAQLKLQLTYDNVTKQALKPCPCIKALMFDDLFCFRDHVQWTEEELEDARQKAKENSAVRIPLKEQGGSTIIQKYLCWITANDPYSVE